ncbi:MAG: NAD-dependent epimerase/dehydratase family protein [Ruminococcaceae bacterium]|nr:NAD-dependent epimerase/dehydratase family protein [Oscillospiraceae bacterium]
MRVLVLGGTGILGGPICKLAATQGMDVFCLSRSAHPNLQTDGIQYLVGHGLTAAELAKNELLKTTYFDVVMDLLSFEPDKLKEKLDFFNGNCGQYIFVSSATVYANTLPGTLITEDHPLENAIYTYARQKIDCEHAIKSTCKKTGQNYTIIRPYITYGDTRIPYGWWTGTNRLLCGKPAITWGGGASCGVFTHADDFCVGAVGLFGNPHAKNEAFHITSEEYMPWRDILGTVCQALQVTPQTIDIPLDCFKRPDNLYTQMILGDRIRNRIFDNTKIKKAVPGFSCKISLQEGVKRAVEYHMSNGAVQKNKMSFFLDGWIDHMIACAAQKSKTISTKKLRPVKWHNGQVLKPEKREYVQYYSERYTTLYKLNRMRLKAKGV